MTIFKRQIALPTDHGSWVFLFSPLVVGLFAGREWSAVTWFVVLGALSGFLIRQPISVAVKVYSGRRGRQDLPGAAFWSAVYAVCGAAAVAGLVWQGAGYILLLAVPALPVFLWHLWLISRREDRRQAGIEIVATGVLALAAPAAYWAGRGEVDLAAGSWLFGLTWLQSAASIVYAYARLEQRELKTMPAAAEKFRIGRRALLYTSANLALTLAAGLAGWTPAWIFAAFGIQWLETIWGTLNPAVRAKPVAIGTRQLIVSILFTVVFIVCWLYS